MGAEELVGRAGQVVAVPGRDVHAPVGGQVDGVHEDLRSLLAGEGGDGGHRVDGAHGVGGGAHRHQARARREGRCQRGQVQRQSAGPERDVRTVAPASRAASTQGHTLASWSRRVTTTSSPGRQVRARARDSDEGQAVMLGPKAIAPGSSAPSRAATASRARGQQRVGRPRAPEHPARVGVAVAQVVGHRLDDPRRHLAARRAVEEHRGPASAGNCRRTAWTSNPVAPDWSIMPRL